MLDLNNTSTRSISDGSSLRSKHVSLEVPRDKMQNMFLWDMEVQQHEQLKAVSLEL